MCKPRKKSVFRKSYLVCWILAFSILSGSLTGCSRGGGGDEPIAETLAQSSAANSASDIPEQAAGNSTSENSGTFSAEIVSPASDITIAAGQSVSFRGSFAGGSGAVTCRWSFDGAAPEAAQSSPGNIAFITPGSYTVSFTAVDQAGVSSTDTVNVTVVPDGTPVAEIVAPAADTVVNAGQALSFQGSFSGGDGNITCLWTFGGAAQNSALANPGSVTFSSPGSYTVTFTVTDSDGDTSSDAVKITVVQSNGVPVSDITSPASDVSIQAGQSVTFQGSVTGGDGTIAFAWTFGGAAPDSALRNPGAVTFSSPGTYTVVFTARDEDGDTGSSSVVVRVDGIGSVPVAEITSPGLDVSIQAGQSVNFQGSASGGDGDLVFAWTFGGAAPDSTLQNPGSVTFSTPGTYTVVFTVRDEDGDTGSSSVVVTVNGSNTVPVAEISSPASDTSITAGQSVVFQGSVSAGDGQLTYGWTFGGAAPASAQKDPGTVVFTTIGSYAIIFTVTDSDGDSSSDTVTITVTRSNTVPVAAITSPATDISILVGQSISFQGTVSGGDGNITFAWAFGGASPDSSLQNPGAVTFSAPGRYTVVFTAQDQDGDLSSDSVTVTVEEDTSPSAVISSPADDISVSAGQTLLFQGTVLGGNGRLTFRWSFSGGAPEYRVEDPGNVSFTTAGVYAVTFTVTDSDGDTGSDTVNVTVTPVANGWIMVKAGYSHTAALKSDGTIWAWGSNSSGQLGDGTLIEKTTPVQMGSSRDWKTISLGYYHTASLKLDGTLWVWGENANGQVGDGTLVDAVVPVQIGSDNGWTNISAGYFHNLALKTDGSLWAWGYNAKGQLGNASNTDAGTPLRIGTDSDWLSVSAGASHSVAIKSDGSLWAWGSNSDGQLGDGTKVSKNIPVRIGSDTDWAAVSAGVYHTLALKRDGSLWAWGFNSNGQLGDGTRTARVVPTRIGSDTAWTCISTRSYHTLAQKTDGSLWAWGANSNGQLGDGSTTDRLTPQMLGSYYSWVSIAVGVYHSAAFMNDGTLWTWGNNAFGQLGDGTKFSRSTPTQVIGD